MRECSVDSCHNRVVARNLCDNHYRRMKRNGSPLLHINQEWGNAKTIRADGYIYITRNGKQVMEHRWLMEQSIGRELYDFEVVHHKDGNRENNSLMNLVLMTRSEHSIHHANKMWRERKETIKRED